MSEDVSNLILEHLRHIRSRMDAIAFDVVDLETGVTALEIAGAWTASTNALRVSRDGSISQRHKRGR